MITTKLTVPARALGVIGSLIVIFGVMSPWLTITSDLDDLELALDEKGRELERQAEEAREAADEADHEGDIPEDEEYDEALEFRDTPLNASFFKDDGSYSGFELSNSGKELYGDFELLRYIFAGAMLIFVFAVLAVILAAFGVSTLGVGITEVLTGSVYFVVIGFISELIGEAEFTLDGTAYGISFEPGSGLMMVLVGGIITAVAGVMLRVDKKRRQAIKDRMEMEARYHDTYKAVAKHLAHMGMTGPEHQEILDLMAGQFEIPAKDVEALEGEADWHPSAPGPGVHGGGSAMPSAPLCPSCDAPMEWVPDFGEWYCVPCDSYPFVETPGDAPPMPPAAGGVESRGGPRRGGKAGKRAGKAAREGVGKVAKKGSGKGRAMSAKGGTGRAGVRGRGGGKGGGVKGGGMKGGGGKLGKKGRGRSRA